ncbi:PREDICTED: uncharacterized protein LOC109189895 [Ipomoea nil]|uniref:uncharacterized protein LOC109189895 n=1 Tax=Ipomoea nil TaxID=35883 RepID=UPI000900F34C|nr:PREDICTED: uncharacterized protein LOC109189895 [Ipomoea nil]
MGLREGLKLVNLRGWENIMIEIDNDALVKILNKDTAPDHSDTSMVTECLHLMANLRRVKILHVFTKGNKCADRLVNLGQDADRGTSVLEEPPDSIIDLLQADARGARTRRIA